MTKIISDNKDENIKKKKTMDTFKENRNSSNFYNVISEMYEKRNLKTTEVGTILVSGLMLVIFVISATGFFVMWFTDYYNNKLLMNLVLSNNSDTSKSWINPPSKYDTLLKVHIFNYTNINEYLSGTEFKIKVEDIGPFTYKEHTTKVDVSFNSNFTVTFKDHRSYDFLPDVSTCSEKATFIVPNVPLLTAAVKVDNMDFLSKFGSIRVINSLQEKPFKPLTARDFLWGYKDKILSLTGSSQFGLLKNRNGTSVDSLQICTGEDDIRKFGIITQFNGMPTLDHWNEEECNRIDGTDATMFPPKLLEKHQNLSVFLQVLCRKVPLIFEKEIKILKNVPAFRYKTPLNVFASPDKNSENKCYCLNTNKCMPSGVINATKCYNGAPIFPSFPHFFSGDPIIYKDFIGINPISDLHQTYADIHPRFAFPINGASRIQINIAVHKNDVLRNKISRITDGTILPLIWIEISPGEFTDDIIDKLFISTFGLNAIQHALKYGTLLTCILSFGLIVFGVFNLSKKTDNELTVN